MAALIVQYWTGLVWQGITFDIPFHGDPVPGLIPFSMEKTRESNVAILRFSVNLGSADLNVGTEIRVLDGATVLFGGYITIRERIREGILYGANYECADYNSVLDRIVVPSYTIDAGDTDSTEITALIAAHLAGVGVGAGTINTINNNMQEAELQGTFRECMEVIAGQAGGAHFFVGSDKNLHYSATTGGFGLSAVYNLSDDLTVAFSYPYADFTERTDETRKIDRVYIVGDGIEGWYPAADSGEVYQAIIYNSNIVTQTMLDDFGAAIVDDFGAAIVEYSLKCWEDRFWAQGTITVRHSDFIAAGGSILWARRVLMTCLSTDSTDREYVIEFGDHTTDWDDPGGGGGGGGGSGMGPHNLLSNPYHSDTVTGAPVRGDIIVADSTPEWAAVTHPAAAGVALTTTATDTVWDQTPTWTGTHTWDDGVGNSPSIQFVGGSNNDTFSMFLEDAGGVNDSDFVVKFPAADTDSRFYFRDSGDNDVAHIDADGNTVWDGTAHRFGIADTAPTIVTISGDTTGTGSGGRLKLELAADYDTTFESWDIDAFEDDLRFFKVGGALINVMTSEGQLQIPQTGSGAGVLIGGDAQWYRSAANQMATPDDIYVAGAGLGLIHVDGNTSGHVWRCDGTRAYPAAIVAGDLPDHTHSGAGQGGSLVVGTTDTDATAGSVFFAGVAGVIQQDNTNFFWDDGNNRLGILDNTPDVTLDVAGTVRADRFTVDGAVSTAAQLFSLLGTTTSTAAAEWTPAMNPSANAQMLRAVPVITPQVGALTLYGMNFSVAVSGAQNIATVYNHYSRYSDSTYSGVITTMRNYWADGGNGFAAGEVTTLVGFGTGNITDDATNNYAFLTSIAAGSNTNWAFYSSGTADSYHSGDFKVGGTAATPLAQLHVDQSGAADAVPAIYANQADVSEEIAIFSHAGATRYTFKDTELALSTSLGSEVLWIRTHGDVAATAADIYAGSQLGLAADENVGIFIDGDNSGTAAFFAVRKDSEKFDSGSELFRITEGPIMMLNETACTNQTIGLVINQGANDDHIFDLKSSDVIQPFTTSAEADTFGYMRKSLSGAGGLQIVGLASDDDAVAGYALTLDGLLQQTADTTKSTAGIAAIVARAFESNGTTGVQNVSASGNLFAVRNNTTTRFIVDAEGDLWATGIADFSDGGVRTVWSEANVSSPPTDAELDATFGTPATAGEGFHALVDDNNANTAGWAVWSLGGSWWYAPALTKAV
jgi:hypothetical protein